MRTFLVGGSPEGRPPRGLAPAPGDRVITADRGVHHAYTWGWPVHLLIGDLDSLPPADLVAVSAAAVPTIVAPAAKDETDLELALAQAVAEGAQTLVLCAVLGGRTDHWLANLLLLARPELRGLDVCIADGPETIRLLRGHGPADSPACVALSGAPGDLLSLLPVGGDAIGVSTAGLQYPLRDETLFLGQARGISNVFVGSTARVWLHDGLLMVIQHSCGGEPCIESPS